MSSQTVMSMKIDFPDAIDEALDRDGFTAAIWKRLILLGLTPDGAVLWLRQSAGLLLHAANAPNAPAGR